MAKTAFLFSGQGGQAADMGRDLYDSFTTVRAVYDQASEILGYPVHEFTHAQITMPEIVQPAILTMGYACYKLLLEKNTEADALAGYSLGELTALTAAEAIAFPDAVNLARLRGQLIKEAVGTGAGAMCTLTGATAAQCEQFCAAAPKYVVCAIYNSPEQIIVGGDRAAVAEVQRLVKESGSAVALFQDGALPIHTEKMRSTVEPFTEALRNIHISRPRVPVVSNSDGMFFGEVMADRLGAQLVSPLHWDRVCDKLFEFGAERFIELGPGKMLSSIASKMVRGIKSSSVEDVPGLVRLLVGS